MVGLGESDEEVLQTLRDLHAAGVEIVTLGQYLRPTLEHHPVAAYITPEKFDWYRQQALDMGFSYCASGPMVRSSYLADEALGSVRLKRQVSAKARVFPPRGKRSATKKVLNRRFPDLRYPYGAGRRGVVT